MAKPAPKAETIKNDKRWQSEIIVDMIKRYDFKYCAQSGRELSRLHDSLVNHGETIRRCCSASMKDRRADRPRLRPRQRQADDRHRATCRVAHAPMGVYYAISIARRSFSSAPPGRWPSPKRRPFIDWIHTANGRGEAIRNFVSGLSTINRRRRSRRIRAALIRMMSARQGPIYMCLRRGPAGSAVRSRVEMPPRRGHRSDGTRRRSGALKSR
jgi:hypothetical protein